MCTLQQLENIINEMKDKENKINYLENALKNERNKREKEIKEGTEIIAELKKRLERYKVNDKDKEIARLERENLELKRELEKLEDENLEERKKIKRLEEFQSEYKEKYKKILNAFSSSLDCIISESKGMMNRIEELELNLDDGNLNNNYFL